MAFRKDFRWGVATASYQIEGAAREKEGLNGWDVGSATAGRIFNGHSGDVGCDHFHKFREDVALMKELGVKAYRFSMNWARLFPEGVGRVSEAGKKFYLDLLEELQQNGIEPWITLFHWDYPYALYLKGGWLNPESSDWFSSYAKACGEWFGKYCKHFLLINEPQVFLGEGHSAGRHAPFLKLSDGEVMRCAHNVLLACGKAEKVLRDTVEGVKIGTAQAFWPFLPTTEKDYEFAKKETFSCHKDFGSVNYYTDPLLFGDYPDDVKAWQHDCGFSYPAEDMKVIRSVFDFYGVNTYSGDYILQDGGGFQRVTPPPTDPLTDMRWTVHPDALYYGAKYVWERYHLPVVYTENGVALAEWKDLDGNIRDFSRIDFIRRYLRSLRRATEDGVDVLGYFYWSLLDNFEWAEGFSKKFGLVHVDYDTLERTKKESFSYYKKVISANGNNL